MIVVVFYGLQRGRTKGFLLGLIYGGLEDLISGHFLGSNALIKLIIGFFSGVAQDRLNRDNIYVFIFLVLVATLAKFVLFFMLVATSYAWLPALCDILLPEMAYNGAMAFLASGFRQEGGDLLKWLAGKKRRGGES
ncbi:MAG: rod shape-determining protein MreD [Clostridia bacterium]|nr:rod shape-determining protein MreD [Clostridia bacterium]